jgi:uroporphyrinogen decarboxylase
MSQTSFQRVFAALEHKEPDRIPIDLGGMAVTGINIHALRKLKVFLVSRPVHRQPRHRSSMSVIWD